MSFLDAFNALSDEFNDKNFTVGDEIYSCVSAIDHQRLHVFMLIPSVTLSLLLALTISRKNIGLTCLSGRPGAIFPMDILGRSNRFSYAAAWGAISFLATDVVLQQKYAVIINGPGWVQVFRALLSMLIYGMDYFPLFAALAIKSVAGFLIGTAYAWLFLVINLFQVSECDYGAPARIILIIQRLPILLSLFYLSISLPVRLVQSIKRRGIQVASSHEMVSILNTAKEVGASVEARHVRELLKPLAPEPPAPSTITGQIARMMKELAESWIYHPHEYFRYSSRILSIMTIGVFLLYKSTLELMVSGISGLQWSERLFESTLDTLGWQYTEGEAIEVTSTRDMVYFGLTFLVSTKVCYIVSLSLATLLGVLMILHTLSSYRTNLFSLYKGDFEHIPPRNADGLTNASLLVGSMRYAGYQVGYIAWGYIINFIIFLIITMVIAAIVTLINVGWADWMVTLILAILPLVVAGIVLNLFQMLMARFAFLQEYGDVLALNNRRVLFTFTFFLFFYNIFLGVLSCLMRILKSIVIGSLFLSRLDNSSLPRRFQLFDPGFAAYVGFVHVEAAHSHPVVLVFLRILMMDAMARQMGLDSRRCSLHAIETNKVKSSWKSPRCNARARERWFLLYTLYKNPTMRAYRKHYIDYVRELQGRLNRHYNISHSALGNLMKTVHTFMTPISVSQPILNTSISHSGDILQKNPMNAARRNWNTAMNKFLMALQKDIIKIPPDGADSETDMVLHSEVISNGLNTDNVIDMTVESDNEDVEDIMHTDNTDSVDKLSRHTVQFDTGTANIQVGMTLKEDTQSLAVPAKVTHEDSDMNNANGNVQVKSSDGLWKRVQMALQTRRMSPSTVAGVGNTKL